MVREMVLVTSGSRNGKAMLRHLSMGPNMWLLCIPLLCSRVRCPRLPVILILNVVRLLGQLDNMQRAVEPAMVMVTGLCVLLMCLTSVLIRVWATLPMDSTGAVLLRCVVRLSRCVRWALVMLTSAVTVRTLLTPVVVVLMELVL